jgi:hypothetical protein
MALTQATSGLLANTGVSAGSYGSSTQIPVIAINSAGQVTSATSVAASGGGGGGSNLLVQNQGTNLTTTANTINFVGDGVIANNTANVVTVKITDSLSPFLLMGA